MTSPNYDYEFQAGGSLAADAPTYIQRAADEAIYQAVKAGKFAYVFNSRQMGKSSLRVQTENRLKAEGIRCAAIDLSTLGTEEVSAAQWYRSLIGELNRCLDLLPAQEVDAWLEKQVEVTPVFRLHRFIEDVLLVQIPDQRIVIFIDEIDSVLSLSFPASDFFALIRACYNRQVDNAAYRRLTFVLLGVTTPSQLIRDSSRTPFNIGQAIELTPLTLDRATRLADGLSGWVAEPQQVLAKIFYWTGGQPYLTQRLCALVQEKAMEADSLPWIGKGEAAVAVADLMQRQLIHNWETSDEQAHFKTMRDRLLRREHLANRLLGMYEQILTQGSIPKENSDPHMELRLSGLVVSSNGDLRVFNPTYAQIFDIAWVQTTLESLRPYAESFQAWMTSGCTDESRLLRGQTLTEAEAWAKGKGLSDLDDRYLRESQAAENRDVKSALERSEALKQEIEARQQALEQFNQEAEAQIQKQNRRIRNRSRIAVATLIASLVGGAFALSAIVLFNNARDDLDVVREVAQLERAGLAAQEKFSLRETAALWDAFRAAHRAVQIYKESNGNHLASSPILALQMSLEQKKEILLPSFKGAVEQPTTLTEFTPEGNRVLTIMNEHGDIGLWDLEGNLITQFKGHEDLINRANISPNGEYIVTASKDDAIRILSIDGSLIKTMNSISPITNISFSPNGKNFGILEQNGILNIWDSKGSRVSTLGNETDPIEELIFGSNGKIVLLRRAQSNAYILDFLEDKIVNLETNKKTISSIKFSHDRTHILASTDDGWIFIWDLEGNQRLSKQVHGEISEIIPNTDDNNFIIILDGFAELWNFEGTKVADFYPEKWAFDNANFNPEGDTILLREANGFMSLWDLDGNQTALMEGHEGVITKAAFNNRGDLIATGNNGNKVILWDLQGNQITVMDGHQFAVKDLKFNSKSTYLSTTSSEGVVRLWDLREISESTEGHQGPITPTVFSPNENFIVSTGIGDKQIFSWEIQNGRLKPVKRPSPKLPENDILHINEVFFHDDEYSILTVEIAGENRMWLWSSDAELMSMMTNPNDGPLLGRFNTDCNCIYSVSSDGTVPIWDLRGNQISLISGQSQRFPEVAFSSDGDFAITTSENGIARIWNLKLGKATEIEAHDDEVYKATFSPNGNLFATTGGDSKIKIWELNGNKVLETEIQNQAPHIKFSPNRNQVLIGSADGSVQLWNLDNNVVSHFEINLNGISEIQYSPDGNHFAITDRDGVVGIWLLNGQQIAEYSVHGSFNKDWTLIANLQRNPLSNNHFLDLATVYTTSNLDELITDACDRLTPYLMNNPDRSDEDRALCGLPPLEQTTTTSD